MGRKLPPTTQRNDALRAADDGKDSATASADVSARIDHLLSPHFEGLEERMVVRQASGNLVVVVLIMIWWLRLGRRRCYAWSVSHRVRHHSRLFSIASEWKGLSHSTSDFVTHVLAGGDSPTVADAIASALSGRNEIEEGISDDITADIPLDNAFLKPRHYLQLGAVWFLPADAPRDPSQGQKPVRLSLSDLESTLEEGDYLRVHHTPRRFPRVYNYNWTAEKQDSTEKPGVIVARYDEKCYWVIDKPAHVPVHPTVDNALENVADMIRQARTKQGEDDVYVTTPQRLDQNTSGLFVVATNKTFASYYAKLLRRKTDQQLSNSAISDAIHKSYKCLLCLIAPSYNDGSWSVTTAMNHLQTYANEQRLMRHYLEPSIRAPKHFAATPSDDTWAECLLRLTDVGGVCPLVGTEAGKELAIGLWNSNDAIPSNCVAVVEVEVELLTGRTHQIRGQLSAEGFPLVGDAQYGGAIPQEKEGILRSTHYIHSDELALQCSQLEFLDPDVVVKDDGTEVMIPSERWNTFRLEDCWWTPLIEKYRAEASAAGDATTSLDDANQVLKMIKERDAVSATEEQDAGPSDVILPPQVQLSPGAHKYIMVKATHPSANEERWFVKSADPSACGGPYHANVAQDLVEWLQVAGYNAVVTGGGRIEYNAETEEACVFGFSYGFGKGDHERAASIISEWSNGSIKATYDNSDSIY